MEALSLPLIVVAMLAIILWGVLGQRAAEQKQAEAEAEAEAQAEAEKARPQTTLGPRRR